MNSLSKHFTQRLVLGCFWLLACGCSEDRELMFRQGSGSNSYELSEDVTFCFREGVTKNGITQSGEYYVKRGDEEVFVSKPDGLGHDSGIDVKLLLNEDDPDTWIVMFSRNGGQVVVYGMMIVVDRFNGDEIKVVRLPFSCYGVSLSDLTNEKWLLKLRGQGFLKVDRKGGAVSLAIEPEASSEFSNISTTKEGHIYLSR